MRRRCCCSQGVIPARDLTATVYDHLFGSTVSFPLIYSIASGEPRWTAPPGRTMGLSYDGEGEPRLSFGSSGVICTVGVDCSPWPRPPGTTCSSGGITRVNLSVEPFIAEFTTVITPPAPGQPGRSCCCSIYHDITITE